MARQVLTPLNLNDAGQNNPTMTAAHVDGHSAVNLGDLVLVISNADASPTTVTIQTPALISGLTIQERTFTLAAGQRLYVSGLKPSVYNQSDGTVWIDFSNITAVTLMALKLI